MLFERLVPPNVWMKIRPDAVTIWSDEEVKRRLNWYYRVMINEAPAKFIIARHVESPEKPDKLDLESLWNLHRELSRQHRSLWLSALRGNLTLNELVREKEPSVSYLDVKIEIAYRIIKRCIFCEHRCGIDRTRSIGACRLDDKTYVHSWFHHLGEEAPLVPSGTIFYGGCNFRCVYCQNHDISQELPREGVVVTPRQLALMQKELREYGARNINHVGGEPTPNIHTILHSFKYLDVNVPQLWNSNMYLTVEAMSLIADVIDIWLPDFKYGNNKCSRRLSAIPNYFEIVTRNLRIAASNGDMIIRHLVLPGHLECCTKPILRWIAENLPKDRILVNIMDQYRPEYMILKYPKRWPELTRRLYVEEIREAYEYARKLGILFEPVS
ncbi:MAG: radical SAM protein [Pyrodictiaceae archaeon]